MGKFKINKSKSENNFINSDRDGILSNEKKIKKKDKISISIQMPIEMKLSLSNLAKKNRLTLAGYIKFILQQEINKKNL